MNSTAPNGHGQEEPRGAEILRTQRGSFHVRYRLDPSQRDKRNKWPRLLDCLKCIAPGGDPEYFYPCETDEFAVVDLVTREKGWLERPAGASPEILTGIIESHFAATAFQVAPELWVV